MRDDPNSLTTLSPPEAGEISVTSDRSFAAIGLALVLVGIASVGLSWVYHELDRVDNSPADYAEFGARFSMLGFVACLLAGAAAATGWNHDHRAFRRASRFTGVTVIVCVFLWRSPVPIGYFLSLGLLIGAGLFVLAVLDPLFALVRSTRPLLRSRFTLVASLAAFAAASAAMILLKVHGMGWAAAID